jgi:leucyl-tRNA synthetase
MRDAGFSRQRYWGEPFPIIWSDGIPLPLDEKELPLELPHVEKYGPGKDGEGPLSNLKQWVNTPTGKRETSTMPGYAGSSWYFLRYMDPHNNETFADRKATDYWNQVDVYIGGTEHAVGHLLYSRLWTKVLYDLGYISFDEPFKKLVNQGMIQGSSRFVFRIKDSNKFVSSGLKNNYEVNQLHVDVNIVDGVELNIEAFQKSKPEYANAEFILEDGKYICGVETEKMSKSKYNTVNPDVLVDKFGADTFRMYEMFLGPVEQSKPWDTKGIEGVHRFLKKLWRLFFDEVKGKVWTEEKATAAELKVLHKTIKKIEEDTERFSFNTAVSAFMVCVNELSDLKCHKKEILEPLLILLTPYAPHISEELYQALENSVSILNASYPKVENKYLLESEKEYPVSINGKLRTTITISLDAVQNEVEKIVLDNEIVQKWLDGKPVKKIIFIKNKMVNVVV